MFARVKARKVYYNGAVYFVGRTVWYQWPYVVIDQGLIPTPTGWLM